MADKSLLVMAGFIIEGEIAAGMSVRLPLKENVMVTAEIDYIEQVRRPDGDITGLCIRCSRPGELALWEALKIKDRTVEVIKAA